MWSAAVRSTASSCLKRSLHGGFTIDRWSNRAAFVPSTWSKLRLLTPLSPSGRVASFSTSPDAVQRQQTHRVCTTEGCSTTAHYGWRGGRRDFCGKHKIEAMVNLSVRLCTHPDECRKSAYFGFPGSPPTHCGFHKLEGMEDVKKSKMRRAWL